MGTSWRWKAQWSDDSNMTINFQVTERIDFTCSHHKKYTVIM